MTPATISGPRKAHPLAVMGFGALFGFVLCGVGFTDYDEFHKMLTFVDLRMFLAFCGSVAISAVGYRAMRNIRRLPTRWIHKGTIPGGVLFGVGWAVTGACPGVAFAQLGEGKLWALATLAGVAVGTLAYQLVHARFLRFDRGSCG